MLHIVLMLLKIIGIIIVVALGIILLCLGIVLFVPIRYQIEAEPNGKFADTPIHLKFSWFLHIVSGYIDFRVSKFTWQLRVFWKKLNKKKKETEDKVTIKNETINKAEPKKTDAIENDEKVSSAGDTSVSMGDDNVSKVKRSFLKKIKYTILNFCDKIKLLINKKNQVKDFLQNKTHKRAWHDLKKELILLCKAIRPKKLVGKIEFGFDDPSLTGKTLAGLSILYPFYPSTIEVYPDFTQEVFQGKIHAKGKIRGIHLVKFFWKIYFNKNIMKTFKEIKKIKDSM